MNTLRIVGIMHAAQVVNSSKLSDSSLVWWSLVVPTDQGSNPGIAPKKKNPSLCSLAWAVASPAQVTVRCAGLCVTVVAGPSPVWPLWAWTRVQGVFSTRVIRSLLNCNAVGAVLPPPVEFCF